MYKYIEEGYYFKEKERIRIAFITNKVAYGLIWIEVGKDGSIYTNLIEPFNKLYISKKKIEAGKKLEVKYDEIEQNLPITNEEMLKGNKHSFHPTGVKHIAKQSDKFETKSFWKNIEHLCQKENVCKYIFKNIYSYQILETQRKNDIVINYPMEDGYPIVCDINIQPFNQVETIKKTTLSCRFQYNLYLVYEVMPNFKPIVIEIIFYHNECAPYPPKTYCCWFGEPYDSSKAK